MAIKIGKIEDRDREGAKHFCLGIFEEMGWPKEFAYGFDNIKEFFGGEKEVFFAAKSKKKIIACAGLKELSKTEGLIKRFYIAKEFRGKGLAQKMLKKIKDFAEKKNYKTIMVDIFQNNERAKRFFQKQGFEIFELAIRENWLESSHPDKFEFRKLNLC